MIITLEQSCTQPTSLHAVVGKIRNIDKVTRKYLLPKFAEESGGVKLAHLKIYMGQLILFVPSALQMGIPRKEVLFRQSRMNEQ